MVARQIQVRVLFLAFFAVFLIETVCFLSVQVMVDHPILLLGLTRVVEAFALICIASKWGSGLSSIGLEPSSWIYGFKMGLIWSAGFAAAAGLGSLLLLALGFNPMNIIATPVPKGADEVLILFLVGGVIGPTAEEIFFRGLIFGFFRRWGFALALVVSTTLFVLIHPIGASVPITQLVGGIVFAVAYERVSSLLAPITIHSLGNMALFSISLLFQSPPV
jgi:membrane protease YdiL (CAAX protease family)